MLAYKSKNNCCLPLYIMQVSTVVVDNFINNPIDTRAFALDQQFCVFGNYPGVRTRSFANKDWIPFLEMYLPKNEKITWFDTHPFSYNGSFQACGTEDGDSWIHHDITDWGAILFLGDSDTTPINTGLTLYRHKPSKSLAIDCVKPIGKDDYQDAAQWETSVSVGNVFNRLVLFRGRQFHKSSMYFGNRDDLKTARLFQVFFFNTSSPPLVRWSLNAPSKMKVHMVIFSTNRFEYLEKMLSSIHQNVSFEGCEVHTTLYDDYPAARDSERMRRLCKDFNIDDLVEHDTNIGLGATWREAWESIKESPSKGDWVFHVEEDVEFVKEVSIKELVETYVNSKEPLTQVFLKRNMCYDPKNDFIAWIEEGGGDEQEMFTTQSYYFVAMCSLYPRDLVCRYDYKRDPHEHTIRDFFKAWGMKSAMYGVRKDPPIIHHLGEWSRGRKASDTDPCVHQFERVHQISGDYHYKYGTPRLT